MVKVDVDKVKELVTFTTTLVVDGKMMELSVTKHLGYQSKDDLTNPTFENTFYWSEDAYTSANPKNNCNHNAHRRMVETDYHNKNGDKYEVQWAVKKD